MKLSRPAAINMFLCPGLGHMAAGWRVSGAILTFCAVGSAFVPLATFVWGVATPPECWTGLVPCGKEMFAHAWSLTWPRLQAALPVLALTWIIGFLHGNTLSLPEERDAAAK